MERGLDTFTTVVYFLEDTNVDKKYCTPPAGQVGGIIMMSSFCETD